MNNTIKLIIEYQKNQDNDIFDKLVMKFENVFKFNLKKVSNNYRNDLYQELLIGFNKFIKEFIIRDNYKFNKEIFTNDLYLKYIEYGVDFIKEEYEINYLDGFIDKYDDDLFIDSFKNDVSKDLFIYEYNLFCNENQFIKKLMLRIESLTINFIKKYRNNKEEYNLLLDKEEQNQNTAAITLTKKDQDFLNLFLKDNKILTEQQVANILGVTQQAVNKRKKSIYKKLNK